MSQEPGSAVVQAGGAGAGPLGLSPGSTFAGRFLLEAAIGQGGMGVVYRARDQLVGEVVALKLLLRPSGETGELATDFFRREVRLARRVTHPHVVRIHDLGEHAGCLYLTMELVAGHDLRRELPGGRVLPAVRVCTLGAAIAAGLEAAHAAGVVHRDLKPENILLGEGGRILVSDFGIARAVGREGDARTGGFVGTPHYVAPEQLEGGLPGPEVDVYALGLVLYEALVGDYAFSEGTPFATAIARLQRPPPDPRARAAVPDALAALVLRCLARQPADRPTATEAGSLLRELSGRLGAGRLVTGAGLVGGGAWSTADESASPGPTTPAELIRRATGDGATLLASAETYAGIGAPIAARGRTHMPLPPSETSLAVLPFVCRGPAEHAWLGEAIAGELIDTLSRTRGLRVLGSGAVAPVLGDRDPRRISEALGVAAVVEGTAQIAARQVRVVVRLVDGAGAQRWSERFDLALGDLFELQEKAARRIAEALRLEVTTFVVGGGAPPEAVERYLRARRILRAQLFAQAHEAVALLEEALSLAPSFGGAQAAHALASVLVWFYPAGAPARDWQAVATASVARALEVAPDAAEAHVAAARLCSHGGDLRGAVGALRRALAIAPTSADVHHMIGQLECETGRLAEGLARLAQAEELEPTASTYPYERARAAALAGDRSLFDECLEVVARRSPGLAPVHLALREAAWSRDEGRLRAVIGRAESSVPELAGVIITVARGHLGELSAAQVRAGLAPLLALPINPRLRALVLQNLLEVQVVVGALDEAMGTLEQLGDSLLYDVTWLDRCRLLDPLRARERFLEIVRATRERCDRVWAHAVGTS